MHQRFGPLVLSAHLHAVRSLEVLDRRGLAQKLWIGDCREVGVGARFADDPLHLVSGVHRNRGLGHHHGEVVEDAARASTRLAQKRRRDQRLNRL